MAIFSRVTGRYQAAICRIFGRFSDPDRLLIFARLKRQWFSYGGGVSQAGVLFEGLWETIVSMRRNEFSVTFNNHLTFFKKLQELYKEIL